MNEHIKFESYHSIENVSDNLISKFISFESGNPDINWYITEKIHGANFSFIADGSEVLCGRRSGIVSDDENFYGHTLLVKKYRQDVLDLFEYLKSKYPDLSYVFFYGEIFGGFYPGFENEENNKPVQKGIWYSNIYDCLIFDVKIKKEKSSNISTYLSYSEMKECFENIRQDGLKLVPSIKTGRFVDLIKTDPNFPSQIYLLYGLPEVENNIAEGYIIKADMRTEVNHNVSHKNIKKILKNKSDNFLEKTITYKVKKIEQTSENEKYYTIIPLIQNFCNQNRFNGTVSKLGLDKNIKALCGYFISDAIDDFKKDDEIDQEIKNLLIKNEKNIKKDLSGSMIETVDEWLKMLK